MKLIPFYFRNLTTILNWVAIRPVLLLYYYDYYYYCYYYFHYSDFITIMIIIITIVIIFIIIVAIILRPTNDSRVCAFTPHSGYRYSQGLWDVWSPLVITCEIALYVKSLVGYRFISGTILIGLLWILQQILQILPFDYIICILFLSLVFSIQMFFNTVR